MALNPWQITLFRHNGFMRLPGVIPSGTVKRLREAVRVDVDAAVEPVVRGDDQSVIRISNVLERDDVFWEVATSPLVLDPLEDILGPNIEMLRHRHNHVQLVTRQSYKGSHFHRDCLTWTRNIATVIFFIEESTVEKGCTKVIPGSHYLPWIENAAGSVEGSQASHWEVFDQDVLVEMPAGGMLLIDSQILHSLGINKTDQTRMSMTVGYCAADELSTVREPQKWLVHGDLAEQGNVYPAMASRA